MLACFRANASAFWVGQFVWQKSYHNMMSIMFIIVWNLIMYNIKFVEKLKVLGKRQSRLKIFVNLKYRFHQLRFRVRLSAF